MFDDDIALTASVTYAVAMVLQILGGAKIRVVPAGDYPDRPCVRTDMVVAMKCSTQPV